MFAGVETLARMVGKTPRRVTADLSRLIALGVLTPASKRTGGAKQTTHYRLNVEALTPRNPDASVTVSLEPNPDASDRVSEVAEPRRSRHETLTMATETLTLVTDNPDANVTRSTSNNQEQPEKERTTAAPSSPTRNESPSDFFKVVKLCAYDVVNREGGHLLGLGELAEEVKQLCADRRIPYDSDVVARATAAVHSHQRLRTLEHLGVVKKRGAFR
jgi:hypothetical protein